MYSAGNFTCGSRSTSTSSRNWLQRICSWLRMEVFFVGNRRGGPWKEFVQLFLLKLFMYILYLRIVYSQDSAPINSQLRHEFPSAVGCPQLPSSALNMLFRSIATVISAALFAQSACAALTPAQVVTEVDVVTTVSASVTKLLQLITTKSSLTVITSTSKVIVIRLLNRRRLNPSRP